MYYSGTKQGLQFFLNYMPGKSLHLRSFRSISIHVLYALHEGFSGVDFEKSNFGATESVNF